MRDAETYGFVRIVRDGERPHSKIGDIERGTRFENAEIFRGAFGHLARCAMVAIDGDVVVGEEGFETSHVVDVFVRNENACDVVEGESRGGQVLANSFRGKPRIYENRRGARSYERAISFATTGEDDDFHETTK